MAVPPASGSWDLRADVLSAAFARAPVGVGVCDEDGRFLAVNDCLLELFKHRREEVVGRPYLNFVHPKARAASLAAYFGAVVAAAAQPPPPVAHSELRCVAGDGSLLWVAVSWTITAPDEHGHQYGIVHLRDITQDKATQRELTAVRARLELAFDCAPIGVAVVGLDGQLLQTNRALQSLLGYHADQLAALSFLDIAHPGDRADAVAVFDQLRAGAIEVHETVRRYLHRDGRVVYGRRIAAAARGLDQRDDYILLQIEDITAQRRATDRLVELAESDQVTGLATLASLARHADLSGQPRSLVLAEVEDLPRLSGVLGRTGTEQLISQLAQRLRARCRSTDVLARVGDGGFAILVADPDGTAGSMVAARLVDAFAQPVIVAAQTIRVSAHIGIAKDPNGDQPLDAIIQQASLAARPRNAAANRSAGARAWRLILRMMSVVWILRRWPPPNSLPPLTW
ncbi:MAG: hypothetical protein QOE97_253 [Pseudonocardiales bacterium]|nr:hypothetical protein [Pseudonocardiales bacterium]